MNLLGLPEEGGTKGFSDNFSLNLKFDEASFPPHLVSRSYAVGLARERGSRWAAKGDRGCSERLAEAYSMMRWTQLNGPTPPSFRYNEGRVSA